MLVRDFHLARGVFRPRTADEQAQADSFANSVAQAQASGLENAEVLAELQKLQEQKPSWSATFPILILSLILFVIIGVARWNWQFTVLIIPVLLFHECGHWAAMRMFHYRNLRMFFIPLFGAAVTGHHWNVPGWKKALVSLAGPLPGIALGIFLGVAGIAWKMLLLSKAALLLIFINGFNLLPGAAVRWRASVAFNSLLPQSLAGCGFSNPCYRWPFTVKRGRFQQDFSLPVTAVPPVTDVAVNVPTVVTLVVFYRRSRTPE